jgi:hypothetical protein
LGTCTDIPKVVERDSATILGDPEYYKTIEIHKDHSGLNKCMDRKDPVYREISAVINQVMRALKFREYTEHKTPNGKHYPTIDSLFANHHRAALPRDSQQDGGTEKLNQNWVTSLVAQ